MAGVDFPPSLQDLIAALRRLPSIGPRSAERLGLHLVQAEAGVSQQLAAALIRCRDAVRACPQCGFYCEGDELCAICGDADRDGAIWCVVEQASDVLRLERANSFRGLYHVLGGRLSPLDRIGPEQLRIASLERRLDERAPEEVILALSADVEGETTALYLAPILKKHQVRVTRLATGLPAGGGLEFADSVTLGYALKGRREM